MPPIPRRFPFVLFAVLAATLFSAHGAEASSRRCAGADATPTATNGAVIRRATVCLLNRERARKHLRAIRAERRLAKAAEVHSKAMVGQGFFRHESPGGDTLLTRAQAVNYVTADVTWSLAENIAWGTGTKATPAATVKAWMHSPPHRANILAGWARDAGVGVALGTPDGADGATYTLDFGRRS